MWRGLAAILLLAACESAPQPDANPVDIRVDTNAVTRFATSSQMYKMAKSGTVRIGVKFDQPGLGYRPMGEGLPSGFDIEIGKMLAAKLGIEPSRVRWVETESEQRESVLRTHKVDFVVASYSLSDERRKVVGQAGPYFLTGQRLLVKRGSAIKDVADVAGKEVCAVAGSSALANIEAKGAKGLPMRTTRQCRAAVLTGKVGAMTAEGALLLGYAAQDPERLAVVGTPLTEERFGVGYAKDRPELCQFIVDTLEAAEQEGTWARAFRATLGKSGAKTPAPPEMDECP